MKDVTLKLLDVHKTFGSGERIVRVLNGITLELRGGQSLAVMGPSGSGKSTLLHLIGTLDQPTSGTIEINGKNPFSLAEPDLALFRNQGIGFIFQDHHLLPQYTVLENVMLPALAFKRNSSDPQSRALSLLKRVGLEHRVEHYPAQLSGGESQRTAVARALMNEPSIILCDEPTGNLDHVNAESVASLLFELHQQENNLLITVTHSQELARKFQQCFELRDGALSAISAP
jgi:lipoprotein-releasing system ATP-binding protein